MSIINFNSAVKERHERRLCNCWDCLRGLGITPPKSMRGAHPSLYPFTLFEQDPDGDPVPSRRKKEDQVPNPEEGHHLREAVRNRSVI